MTPGELISELYKVSSAEPDWRDDRGKRHVLAEVLVVTVLALIAGAQNAEDVAAFGKANLDWFRRFLVLRNGTPAHDLILDVLAVLKPEKMMEIIRDWLTVVRGEFKLSLNGAHVAFDGQRLRGSMDRAAGNQGVHLVSAYATAIGHFVATVAVDEKTNEIPVVQQMIGSLDLRGATISADAMHCQTQTAAAARTAGAHYVLQVKENQPVLLADCKATAAALARRVRPGESKVRADAHTDTDKGHGRVEKRKSIVCRDLSHISASGQWVDLQAVVIVLRERFEVLTGKSSQETSYYITSRQEAGAEQIGEIVRNHWLQENRGHWVLDCVFGSDSHQVRQRNAAVNFGMLRRFCAGLVDNVVGWGQSRRRVRMQCGWSPDTLLSVLAGQVIDRPRMRRVNRKGAKDEVPPARRRTCATQADPTK